MVRRNATLKVVLFADLAHYTRLVAADEAATLGFMDHCFELFRNACGEFGAELVKTMGDGVLLLFDSAPSAVDYAMALQARVSDLAGAGRGLGRFRMGLHMGEVRRREGDAFGHAVNVAARVQTQAQPGGVCVTDEVYKAAHHATGYVYRYAGRPYLKNVPAPLSLYHVLDGADALVSQADLRVRISVIDGVELRSADDSPIALRSQTARALVGHLALTVRHREQRDRLATLLWPDRPLPQARRALNGSLQILRKAFPEAEAEALLRTGSLIGLREDLVSVDLISILRDLDDGRVDDLLLQRPDIADCVLLGLEDTSVLFAAWLRVTRRRLHESIVDELEALLERFDSGEPVLKRAAMALLAAEPSHERAARRLVRYHVEKGNAAAATRVFDDLCTVLQAQYGLEPSPETIEAVSHLTAQQTHRAVEASARVPRARAPVIAVEAFHSESERFGYAASGFRSELIANLSRFRQWSVIEPPADLGEDGADYLLRGELSCIEDEVRLSLRLSEASARKIVWSDSLAVSRKTWAKVQQEVVAKIASTLEIYLSHDRLARVLRRPLYDLGAYDAWLRGEYLLTFWSPKTEDEAEALFEHAIAEDPGFPPAYASLASVYNSRQFIRPGIKLDQETSYRALELSHRSVALDPLDARNQMALAWSSAVRGQFGQSEVCFELAAQLNPNSPGTLISAALGLAFLDRIDAATDLVTRAIAVTPMLHEFQWSHVATIRHLTGDFAGALEAAERSNDVIVDTPGWTAAALLRLGRRGDAELALARLETSVAAVWQGATPPTRAEVIEWFLSIFPIKNKTVVEELAADLRTV